MFTSLLNQTLTIQRKTIVGDGIGGHTTIWADLGSFKGRISPVSAQEKMMQDKNTMGTTHRIYCDPMTVQPTDRIRWGSYYFEIIGVRNPSELYHHLEIDCREINIP
jgi:head-tail adaptor